MTKEFDWNGDWSAISDATERKRLEDELQRELCPAHVLFGIEATALGRRWRRDDVLFLLGDGRFAQVHLTWNLETDPTWPWTEIYESFEAWRAVPPEDR